MNPEANGLPGTPKRVRVLGQPRSRRCRKRGRCSSAPIHPAAAGRRTIDTYDDDLDRPRNLTPARALRAICVIESRLTAAGSTGGIVAERMKLGLATRSGYEGDGADRTRRELTWLLGLTRDLTEQEQRVCSTHYVSTAGSVGYEELRRTGDLHEGNDEDVIDVRSVDPAGQPLGGE